MSRSEIQPMPSQNPKKSDKVAFVGISPRACWVEGVRCKRLLAYAFLLSPSNRPILDATLRTGVKLPVLRRVLGLPGQLRRTSEDSDSRTTRQWRSRTWDKHLPSGSCRSRASVQHDSNRGATDPMAGEHRRVSWQTWNLRFGLRKTQLGQAREISRHRRVDGWGSISKPPSGRHVFSMARAKHLSPL